MNILSPSLLSVDFTNIGNDVKQIVEAGATWLHLDVMDGVFVPNISFGPPVIQSIRGITDVFFDVHLMITEPIRYVEAFKSAGADILTVHYEACKELDSTIEAIKQAGMKAGIAINPGTPVSAIESYISKVDMILVMSVEPGFGGQKFKELSVDKIREVKRLAVDLNPDLYIQVDGGINLDNVKTVVDAGCNVIVAGSAVFKGDKQANVKKFNELINS